jgi:hypothetical protein
VGASSITIDHLLPGNPFAKKSSILILETHVSAARVCPLREGGRRLVPGVGAQLIRALFSSFTSENL